MPLARCRALLAACGPGTYGSSRLGCMRRFQNEITQNEISHTYAPFSFALLPRLYHPLQCHDRLRATEMGLGYVWPLHRLPIGRFTGFSIFTAPIYLRRKHCVAAARPSTA